MYCSVSDFNYSGFLDLETELPDELMGPGTGDVAHNGTNDPQSLVASNQNNVSQQHHHISQLLQPNSTPPYSGGNNSIPSPQTQGTGPPNRSPNINSINSSLGHTVKSPVSNNLSSPPHGAVSKVTSSQLLNDSSVTSSTSFTMSTNTAGSGIGSMANANAIMKNLNSQSVLNSNTGLLSQTQQHPNQILNGPHYATSGHGQVKSVPSTLTSTLPMTGSSGLISNAINAQQPGHQNMNHPNLNATPSQGAMMKVGGAMCACGVGLAINSVV